MGKELIMPPLQPKQMEFLRAKERYVAYGGSRGGGKTHAARWLAILLAVTKPGIKILFMRSTYPELTQNIILPMLDILTGLGLMRYNSSEKIMYFRNGSRIFFGYCAKPEKDLKRYMGMEYDVIFLEEATNFTREVFDKIKACLRGANGIQKHIYLTCNPGGVGHGWVKRLFIDRRFEGEERPEDYAFIRASVYDNKVLLENDPEYLQNLKELPKNQRAAWLDGDWDALDGRFFSEFSESAHVVAPFAVPEHWRLIYGMDYGLDMLAAYLGAVDERGNVTIIDEVFEPDLLIDQAADRVKEMLGDRVPEYMAAPADMWNRNRDTGRSLAEAFAEKGLYLTLGKNSRVMGWQEVLRYLHHEEGQPPRLRIFSTCANLIESFPLLLHDTRNPNDVAGEPHQYTHGPDAIRIMLSLRPMPAMTAEEQKREEFYGQIEPIQNFVDYGIDDGGEY